MITQVASERIAVRCEVTNINNHPYPTLTEHEAAQLDLCERDIEKGLNAFLEVGAALLTIRDERLYRANYGDFQTYCKERWSFGRSYAHRLIRAAEVVGNLKNTNPQLLPIGDNVLPENEAQVRGLAVLSPDAQRDAWKEAVERAPEGKVTAKLVALVVENRIGVKPSFKPANVESLDAERKNARSELDVVLADIEHINPRLETEVEASELGEFADQLTSTARAMRKLAKAMWSGRSASGVSAELDSHR